MAKPNGVIKQMTRKKQLIDYEIFYHGDIAKDFSDDYREKNKDHTTKITFSKRFNNFKVSIYKI